MGFPVSWRNKVNQRRGSNCLFCNSPFQHRFSEVCSQCHCVFLLETFYPSQRLRWCQKIISLILYNFPMHWARLFINFQEQWIWCSRQPTLQWLWLLHSKYWRTHICKFAELLCTNRQAGGICSNEASSLHCRDLDLFGYFQSLLCRNQFVL